jgi:prepilin-type processing-associated H-X9-DG protein
MYVCMYEPRKQSVKSKISTSPIYVPNLTYVGYCLWGLTVHRGQMNVAFLDFFDITFTMLKRTAPFLLRTVPNVKGQF